LTNFRRFTTLPARFGPGETCERIDFVQNITKSPAERFMAKQDDSGWGKMASAGLEVAVGVGLGVAVGYWIDKKCHSDPWGILIGAALGFAAGMYLLFKDAIKANKD
jgi:F0F1-type ATP synthase assembly protein I